MLTLKRPGITIKTHRMLRRLAYMSTTVITPSGVTIQITPALRGGVTPTPKLVEQRIREALEQIRPGAIHQPSRADVYGPGRTVSFERAAETTHRLQQELDDAVARENSFDEASMQNGLAPCQRVRRGNER